MHAHFNLHGNNSNLSSSGNEQKNQRSNPLLKTSKISHSAKDIMKNLKAAGTNHHNESTSTSSTSNSSMGTSANSGVGKMMNLGLNNLNINHLPFIEPSRI